MRHGLGDLALGKPVIHPNRDMARELRNLTACDERADRDEAAVARRKIGAQPQVAKQHFRRVLHNTGEQGTEQIAYALGAIGFRGFVERQQIGRGGRQLIRPDATLGEDVPCRPDRRNSIRPASAAEL